jgi:hypothetical protein
MLRAKAILGGDHKSSRTHRGPRAQHVFKVGNGTQEIQKVLFKMTKEILQSLREREFRIHLLEVRRPYSSVEVGQCPWSEGGRRA